MSASTLSDHDLHAVFSGMPDGLVVYDRDGKIVMWNRAAENILQITAEQFEVLQRYQPLAKQLTSMSIKCRSWVDADSVEFELVA